MGDLFLVTVVITYFVPFSIVRRYFAFVVGAVKILLDACTDCILICCIGDSWSAIVVTILGGHPWM